MLSRVPATGDVRGDVLSVLSTACSDTRSRPHSIARSNAGTARHRRRFVRECHRRRRRSRRQLEKIVNDPAVDVRFTNANSRPAPGAARLDSELFKTVEAAVTKIYNAPTLPSMSTGATDMAQVRSPGAQCIGIGSAIDVEDQIKGFGMHSDQERLLESELYRFVRFQYEIVTALARAR
jgi:acetylornithine deacetylase/succinyl-diaminopimelate desuccinylase-like protein